jgi:nucleoside-diphosphate-sugar epimerase
MGGEMKILVTGGLGLIGHNVVKRLQDQGHVVSMIDNRTTYGMIPPAELDYLMAERLKKIRLSPSHLYNRDICDRESIDDIFEIEQPEVVIHMASFPRQKVVNADPAWGSRVMMEGLINVLESAKKHHVNRVVYISSSMVYGDFEDDVNEDAVCRPQGQYGIMKLAGENLVKDYARRGCFDHIIIRPSAVYGPLDVEDRVVSKFMLAAMRGGVLRVNGSGETLDFTYVDDAADGIVAAATTFVGECRTFNITRSHSVSLLQAAGMIIEIVGKGSIELRARDADFPSRGALNIDRARAVLKYDPQVDVAQGFENYYEWFRNSLYWAPKTI